MLTLYAAETESRLTEMPETFHVYHIPQVIHLPCKPPSLLVVCLYVVDYQREIPASVMSPRRISAVL